MKGKYFIWDAAPMNFYKLMVYLILPLNLLFSVVSLLPVSGAEYSTSGLVVSLLRLALLSFSLAGLLRRKWYGVLCLYSVYLLFAACNLFLLLQTGGQPYYFGQTLAYSLAFLLFFLYFSKRRPLFAPSSGPADPTPADVPPAPASAGPSYPTLALGGLLLFVVSFVVGGFCVNRFYQENVIPDYEAQTSDIRAEGYQEGYAEGVNDGGAAGYKDGFSAGKTAGYKDGYSEGKLVYYFEVSFFRTGACIVTEEGYRYHHYGCPHVDGHDFWIYNVELAEAKGYTPCLDCWKQGLGDGMLPPLS